MKYKITYGNGTTKIFDTNTVKDQMFTVSYVQNGVNQVIGVKANSENEAKEKFLNYKKSKGKQVEFVGIREGFENKPGMPVIDSNIKDSTAHEVVVYTNQILSEMGLNNSIGKYDKVVQAMRSLYGDSFLSGKELKNLIKKNIPYILKKYGLSIIDNGISNNSGDLMSAIDILQKAANSKNYQLVYNVCGTIRDKLKMDGLVK